MRVGIFGRGRLAQAVAEEIEARRAEPGSQGETMELAWSLGRGVAVPSAVDVALDASSGEAVREHLSWALSAGTNLVIGATGWDRTILKEAGLDAAQPAPIGVLTAPNFSLGVAFMKSLALALGRFSALDPGSDLAVLERHHRAKADAPSGTAKLLASALAEGSRQRGDGRDEGGFSGWAPSPAKAGEIPVASIRAGKEVGYHELRYESELETIVISHEAKSRALFASGALASLLWIRGRKGLYSFDDMAGEIIGPLFEGVASLETSTLRDGPQRSKA
jgi:4-hydroxy-tetrahydrodipicolinate reductase